MIDVEIGREDFDDDFDETLVVWKFFLFPMIHPVFKLQWDHVGWSEDWAPFVDALSNRFYESARVEFRSCGKRYTDLYVELKNGIVSFVQESQEWGGGNTRFSIKNDPSLLPVFKELKKVHDRYEDACRKKKR